MRRFSSDSRPWRNAELLGPLAGFILPIVLVMTLRLHPQIDVATGPPAASFYPVALAAILALVFSVTVGVAGLRMRNAQVLCLSMAFVTLSMLLLLNGLSVPGPIVAPEHSNQPAAAAAALSIAASAFWLFISSLPTDAPFVSRISRTPLWVLPLWVMALGAFNVLALVRPQILAQVPSGPGLRFAGLSTAVLVLFAAAWWNYWRSWRYSRFPLQRSMLYAIALLMSAQVALGLGRPWHASWWTVHGMSLLAFILLLFGLSKQLRGGGGLRVLFSDEQYQRLIHGVSESVRALVVATEARDRYTGGHNLRVALYALRLAQQMQLSPEERRAIAEGGIIHDVGKLKLPDSILNKPGSLTEEEYAIVKEHPVHGFDIARYLGMGHRELAVIRHHHERVDGAGYPDQLSGEQIPRVARVLAVADVFDALTSTRSYRGAWSPGRAGELIRENSGTHFDPVCVAAWQHISDEEIEKIAAIEGFAST